MYIPKKLKWANLIDFKQFLEQETTEKIVLFEGWRLVTETTEYGIVDGVLLCREPVKELPPELVPRVVKMPVPKKADLKVKSKKQILEEMRARGQKVSEKKKKTRR